MKKYLFPLCAAMLCGTISFAQDDEALHRFEVGSKYGFGYTDPNVTNGVLKIPAIYDDAYPFEEGLAAVKLGDKWGYIDKTGATKLPFKFTDASWFSQGLASFGKIGPDGSEKFGYINKSGVVVIPCKYDDAGNFSGGFAYVKLGGKMGYINKTGVVVVPLKYDAARDITEGFGAIAIANKWGFVDMKGAEITPPKYDRVGGFKNGMSQVAANNKVGFVDATGTEVVALQYTGVTDFDESGKATVMNGYDQWIIDKTGAKLSQINKTPGVKATAPDSVEFTGTVNSKGFLFITCTGHGIKNVLVNGTPIKNIYTDPVKVDFKMLQIKAGTTATVKVIYTKGGTVRMMPNGGLDLEK